MAIWSISPVLDKTFCNETNFINPTGVDPPLANPPFFKIPYTFNSLLPEGVTI